MKTEFSIGLADKFCVAWAAQSGTPAELNSLAEDQKKVCDILLVVRDRAEVVVKSILTFLRAVVIPAQPAVTTSKEYFEEAGVRSMGSNFESQFLGLEVGATEDAELAVRKLEEASLDAPILAELGDKAEISVSQFRAFLAENRESQEWFIFYLKGRDGELWAVDADWLVVCGGWGVDADSVSDPDRWDRGRQVVSRKAA